MDLSLWDSPYDQVVYETEKDAEDHGPFDFSSEYGRDVLEEDAWNEKSCIQVLKILIDKADEDIAEVEDEILMLNCQLIWEDEEWCKQCSAALKQNIDHLDARIQNLKGNQQNSLGVETEEMPPRLHDLLKPLLENYLAKANKAENLMAISKNGKKVTQQQLDNVVAAATPILSFSKQNRSKEDHLTMKPSKKEATDDVKNVRQTSTPRILNEIAKLKYIELRDMARNQNLPYYSKLTKAELIKQLSISKW